jgi:hypothetical protein
MEPEKKDKIEITPEMIAAGVQVIADTYGVCGEYAATGLAEDVFKAMMSAACLTGDAKKE